jgi:hypothetical protein
MIVLKMPLRILLMRWLCRLRPIYILQVSHGQGCTLYFGRHRAQAQADLVNREGLYSAWVDAHYLDDWWFDFCTKAKK